MYIPIILGTAREGRLSEKVANFVLGEVKKTELESEIIDVRDFRIAATDKTRSLPAAKKFAEKASRADGFIIVTPEYNHGFSGELKMLLDMLYEEYFNKPVAFCGVSNGPIGGARGIQLLRLVCVSLGMYPILETVYFPMVKDLFDENNRIKDEGYIKRMQGLIKGITEHARVLKAGREQKV